MILILFYCSNSFRPKFILLTKIFWIGLLFDPSQAKILAKNTHFSTETPFNDVSITSKQLNNMKTTLYITYLLWRKLYQFLGHKSIYSHFWHFWPNTMWQVFTSLNPTMKINQSYIYFVPISRKVCFVVI